MANYSVFYSDDKHRYNFHVNENGTYDFMTNSGEKITLPKWDISSLDLTPSITDLGKANQNLTDYLRLNFGDAILSEAINILKRRDLFTWEYIPYETGFNYAISSAVALYLPYLVSHPIKEFKGDGWERSVDKLCIAVFKTSQYDFWSGKLLKRCLELKYPWLTEFNISDYSIEYFNSTRGYGNHFVYLHVKQNEKSRSIYMPLDALINGDIEAIKKCHTDYFTSYYKWPGGWSKNVTKKDVLGWRKENLDLLESDTFKEFCDYMTGKKEEKKTNKKEFVVTMHVSGTYQAVVQCDEECGLEDLKNAATEKFEEADFGELEEIDIENFVSYSSDEGDYDF